ncbi:SDR family NAD(P)-dependent oxidoreductase [Caulobacter sp. S45]|jgi:NAD(P)-dependent dehydrogenase (short-subunit alcohol dehydrogenase family)|uniref:SDR family NAD(P)-dependent oxidoreductase n=1 Tax=Caulobacter sp. S45 TaxID=1641861 RepID=UPI00131B9D88|nr:SDR family NAD(P)-dependent oxidoreductase [Caulobacter sp. S45]
MIKDLKGKTAVVTGAGSGIGRGIAHRLAERGVNIALADIDAGQLDAVKAEVEAKGVTARTYVLDVSDRAAVYAAADAMERDFGKLHIVCNNAGVGYPGRPLDQTPDNDIDWVFGVNVFGVMNGIKAFTPKLRAHGEEAHMVNTASTAGLQSRPGMHHGLYSASKMAVVALSQGLAEAVDGSKVGVSVLCPQAVDTEIYRSHRVRPDRFGGATVMPEGQVIAAALKQGLSGDQVGLFVVHAIEHGEFFILTHPGFRTRVAEWHQRVMDGFDAAVGIADEVGVHA